MERKERTENPYTIYETTYKEVNLRILKNKNHPFFSVYVKRYADGWYIELSSSKWTNLIQAKSIAEKLCDIALWYNAPEPWKEY